MQPIDIAKMVQDEVAKQLAMEAGKQNQISSLKPRSIHDTQRDLTPKTHEDKGSGYTHYDNDGCVKQPVKEPKWKVGMDFFPDTPYGTRTNIYVDFDNLTEPQAQAIKEAVEALMEYVTNPNSDLIDLLNTIDKARDALRENK